MSGKKPQFTSFDLSKLVDESIAEADQVSEDLKKIDTNQLMLDENVNEDFDDYALDSTKNWTEVPNVIDKDTGESISYNFVYKKICDLIDAGNATLQMIQSIDLDVLEPNLLTAAGSLINTIKGCIAEFTKIHQQWIRFNQAMKMEKLRYTHKKELMKYRNELQNGTANAPQTVQTNELVEVTTSDLVEFLQWKKQKEELEKQKENKI